MDGLNSRQAQESIAPKSGLDRLDAGDAWPVAADHDWLKCVLESPKR
jgi:hypothetical protein